jgi:UDP-glucose 4-epimerase
MEKIQQEFYNKYNLTNICLRFFNVYGPNQNPKSPYSGVISKFIEQSLNNKTNNLIIFGDGKITRDFIFVKDVAKANIFSIKKGEGFKIYNVGTQSMISIYELANLFIKITGTNKKISFEPPRLGDTKQSKANIQKIQKDLGWKPQFSLEEGIKKTIEWYKKINNII